MNAVGFAWRSLVRQPARAVLGVLGVAAVGALLFDMLLLSQGLVVSMRDLLDQTGFDIRVTATGEPPRDGPPIRNAVESTRAIAALPSVRAAIAVRFAEGEIALPPAASTTVPGAKSPSATSIEGAAPADRRLVAAPASDGDSGALAAEDVETRVSTGLQGVSGGPGRPWIVTRGDDISGPGEIVVNDAVAAAAGAEPGSRLVLRASCDSSTEVLPSVSLTVTGVAEFPFEAPGARTIAGTLDTIGTACGGNATDHADMILVASQMPRETRDRDLQSSASTPSESASRSTAAAIEELGLPVRAITNDEVVTRLQESSFTYFQQISSVLTAVTVTFALLLITVLLTVSVNQRLGEIAALRAIGFSATRVVADVLSESALIVGLGGALSLPLGLLLARWLDGILKGMPGIPSGMHFFVFEWRALVLHVGLLIVTAIVAALYPMRVVASLPIAATLRTEVVS